MSKINRRDFLKVGAATTAVAACPGVGSAMELKLGGEDFHQIRTFHPRARAPYLCTMCPYFDGGYTYAEDGEIQKVEGDPNHVATRGKFCSKGLASFFGASDPDRILAPLKRTGPRGSGQWQEISWKDAIAEVAGKVQKALDKGADTVHLNEGAFKDGGTVRFMDTIGSSSVIRSRFPSINNAAKQAATEKALGVDFVLPDLEHTQYVLNFGSNILETAAPLAQRLTDGMVEQKLKLITFDVRMSHTAGRSDEWHPVFPGSDGIVALAMANVIMEKGLADKQFIGYWTDYTTDQLAEHLKQFTLKKAAKASGVAAQDIKRIAIEFAKAGSGAVLSQNGVSYHQGGVDAETACLLLAVITGNIDTEGGNCLPRKFNIATLQPAPEPKGSAVRKLNHSFPFEVKEGARKVEVLFNHMSNPAYSSPAASVWREVLKDEKLIPYIVDFSPFMSETSELADIILPDVVGVERDDVASSPTALFPWISMTRPQFKPRGRAQDVRVTLKKIVEAIDADGSKGMKQYWAFSDAKTWVKKQIEATEGIDKKKTYKTLKKKGAWPSYGKIGPGGRKIVKKKEVIEAEYNTFHTEGLPTPSGRVEIPLPSWNPNPRLADLKPGEFVLSTFKVAYQSLSLTANLKLLSEMWHSNPLWINKEVAHKLGIEDGALVRVTSDVGYLVTKAWVTQGIHPQVVGISTSVGRSAYGRVAQANPRAHAPFAHEEQEDEDIDHNLWWRDGGTNPNDIIPIALDPQSGVQAWNDTVVKVTPAESGDKYGDINVDNAKHLAIYKKSLG
ncbi:MAG TPA: twin-arginine translocation signal domain-containing protein [Sedimenticola sp.]|nr:twin-arginine translocation signal domain-containing protein [Sedimenticola sp.]